VIKICPKRDKDLLLWFYDQMHKGRRLDVDTIPSESALIFKELALPVPVLEYAMRNDGLSLSVTDEKVWCEDFLSLVEPQTQREESLPNIHHACNVAAIVDWLSHWRERNLHFQELLTLEFNAIFCPGAFNSGLPSHQEAKNLIDRLRTAQRNKYPIDGDSIKWFPTKHGKILEFRLLALGLRMFFIFSDSQMIIGGFYRKSGAMSQDKVGTEAAKRMRDAGYLA
jgi:hypothetical protein